MKVKLTVILDLPDEYQDYTTMELNQELFDAYTHYVTLGHASDAVDYCCEAKGGSDKEDPFYMAIFNYHNQWRDISKNAEVSYERLDDTPKV